MFDLNNPMLLKEWNKIKTANDKSVNFELNSDDTYTMKQAWGFLSQPKLPEILKIPETYEGKAVTKVDWFTSAYEIKKIIGSKNLITIEAHAFADSSGSNKMELHEVIFPQDGSLKEIKNWGFFNCRKLQTVVVPENFESFGEGAFLYCISLSDLVIYSLEPPTGAEGLFTEGIYEYKTPAEFKVYVPDEAIDIYKQSDWAAYAIHGISEFENAP